ncbi:MAG: ABC transporter substrate-binding protein [Pseudomonadales bacterium]|nr:ABC transporter substrate-binding protein [Pseudomonadales bacterium]
MEAQPVEWRHGYAFLKPLALPADFPHFGYVNPAAPKGGEMRLAEMGTWDNFNPVSARGRDAQGLQWWTTLNLLYDKLLERAADEPTAFYGRLAESVAVAPDGSWIGFRLRPEARWHDGRPITADDLAFSFEVYRHQSGPTIRAPMSAFDRIEVIGPHEVRYWVAKGNEGDPVLPIRLGNVPVLPRHYWEGRDITATTIEPPLGSGPYRIGDFKVGRYVRYTRVEDYWGRDLPVNRGRYNFDSVKFDYFRDENIQFEAIKGNVIDLREETYPSRWAREYDFPAVRRGLFRTEKVEMDRPAGLWWPVFWNLRQPRFQDVRVREALWLLYDFPWVNSRMSFDYWDYGLSFFHNSEMAHTGEPSALELALLEPLRDRVPERVFGGPFEPPPNLGGGWHRDNVKEALALFEAAGWVIRDGVLVYAATGEPFEIRFVVVSPGLVGALYPYIQALKRVGIAANAIAPETSNWLYRMRAGDFDAGAIAFQPDVTPTLLLSNSFSSAAAEQAYSYNWAHVRDPAVDALIAAVYRAQTYDELIAATRAIDRVLLWNFYYVPGMSRTHMAMTWWDKFGIPDHAPLARPIYYDAWWWDERKAARVAAGRRAEDG